MTDELIAQLFDFGALGLFAGFLIYLYFNQQKRLDAVLEQFKVQLKEIEIGHEERVGIMRERYDVVIREIRAEGNDALRECMTQRDALVAKLGDQIEANTRLMSEALVKQNVAMSKLDEGLAEMRRYRDRDR